MADKELTYKDVWETLSKVDVSKHTEEKMKLTYLSWSRMWNLLMDNYPQAQYEFVDFEGVPYKTLPDGTTEVVTRITIDNLVREMRLPVMDYKNNPVVNPHARQVSDNAMRCLVKNVAMFGLGISVFTGMADETLPDEEKDKQPKGKKTPPKKTETVQEETPVEQVFDEGWADAFVEGAMKLIDGGLYESRDQLVDFYKSNSEAIGVLKDKFPEQKDKLDKAITSLIDTFKQDTDSEEGK
jgi:hypothetical protein|tara:strand:- start:9022 stop:9741 length:720 start_codon:yes stop_codon:yes gene_type:complete